MADNTRERREASPLTTVLNPLRPAVVVRRRVYDTTTLEKVPPPRSFSSEKATADRSAEEENGPPSSINVGRALASLRADELQRVEELVRADERRTDIPVDRSRRNGRPAEDQRRVTAAEPIAAAAPALPTLLVGKTIPLAKLADQMGREVKDLTATLVASGYYSLHAKTILPRETARTIAGMFGWHAEDAPESDEVEASPPKRAASKSKKPKTSKAKAAKSARRSR